MAPSWEYRFRGAVAGKIEAGVAVRASTAELWSEIRGAAAEAGLEIGQRGFELVTEMRSAAAARRTGYERFGRAGPDEAFTLSHAAPAENIRSAASRAIHPQYLVRFDLTFTGPDGTEQTRTVSMRDDWRPGMTVGDVRDAVAEAAEGLANDYGQGMVGFDSLRPVLI